MAQSSDSRSRILNFLITYLVLFGLFQIGWLFWGPKPPPAPQQAQALLQQAQTLEATGRKEDPNLSRADRVKALEQAIQRYEEYAAAHKGTLEGARARFQAVNILDYLARFESKRGDTRRYDEAEHKLKEMEKDFHSLSGTVELEIDGQKVTREGNLSAIATERLNAIRAARDQVNRSKWTWQVMDFFVRLTGRNPAYSYALALLIIVVVLKGLTYPFQKKQYAYQRDLMRIQPLLKEAQEKLKGRPQEEVSRRIMQIYKENNVNLAGGCLPMLVMMFVLLPVFWMVRDYEYQFTNAIFLWIRPELGQKFWWIGKNLAQFDVPLFIIYLLSMVAYSLLQPKPVDPQQAQQQKMMMIMMPLMFGVMMWLWKWSSAFMLYWLILNVVSMFQSWKLMREYGLLTPAPAGAPATAASPAPDAPAKPEANGRLGRNGKANPPGGAAAARPRGARRRKK